MRWFRFYNDAVDDEKLRLLAFEDRWHYTAVLCLKADGLLDTTANELRERKIALKLGLTTREAEEVRRRLSEVGLISHTWQPKGWKKRQYEHDSSANRTKKYRDKLKEKQVDSDSHCDVTVTTTDTDTDTEKEHAVFMFESFWKDYPRKENKQRAQTSFKNLSKTDQQKAIDGIEARTWDDDKKFIMHPTTYLSGKRWEDQQAPNKKKAQAFKKSPHISELNL